MTYSQETENSSVLDDPSPDMDPCSDVYNYRIISEKKTLRDFQKFLKLKNSGLPKEKIRDEMLALLVSNPSLRWALARLKSRHILKAQVMLNRRKKEKMVKVMKINV